MEDGHRKASEEAESGPGGDGTQGGKSPLDLSLNPKVAISKKGKTKGPLEHMT